MVTKKQSKRTASKRGTSRAGSSRSKPAASSGDQPSTGSGGASATSSRPVESIDPAAFGTLSPSSKREDSGSPPTPAADAARAAAGGDSGPSTPPPIGAAPPPVAPVVDHGAALVELTQAIVGMTVQLASTSREVTDEEVTRLSKLTDAERSSLGMFAPLAAPFFGPALTSAPAVAAVAFGLVAGSVVIGRYRDIAAMPRKGKPKTKREPAAQASTRAPVARPEGEGPPDMVIPDAYASMVLTDPTPMEKNAHDAAFGGASDVVPVGVAPIDSGFASVNDRYRGAA